MEAQHSLVRSIATGGKQPWMIFRPCDWRYRTTGMSNRSVQTTTAQSYSSSRASSRRSLAIGLLRPCPPRSTLPSLAVRARLVAAPALSLDLGCPLPENHALGLTRQIRLMGRVHVDDAERKPHLRCRVQLRHAGLQLLEDRGHVVPERAADPLHLPLEVRQIDHGDDPRDVCS